MKATVDEVTRHERGKRYLDMMFELVAPGLWDTRTDAQTGRPTRVRRKPNVPPMQDAAHRARRLRRKTAHESRRRNRA